MSKKNCARYFEIRKCPFLIFEKGMSKKIVLGILRSVSMLFLNIRKGDEQKNCARYFEICKYAF